MAAAAGKTERVGDDSSSSDDEALRRCQEAVWEATGGGGHKDGDRNVPESKRVVVADHQHDGNELKVTQGFQKHVAKKLGSLLDSCISEVQTEASSHVNAAEDDEDDAGFRLFSTSVPGQVAEEPPAPARRRPLPSSSDSDSEMETRLKEAAVSVKDLVTAMSTMEPPSLEQKKKKKKRRKPAEEEEQVLEVVDVVQKKKKKKNQEVSDSAASPLNVQSNGEIRSSELEEEVQTKQKKKKKRKRKGNAEEEELD
ncbi:uncharacterized protein V6R79_008159 [Siganus canaliculatus]